MKSWTYNEEKQEKYPKDRVPGGENHEMEWKVGYKMRKRRENVQNIDWEAANLREGGNGLDMIEKISFNMSKSKQSVVENQSLKIRQVIFCTMKVDIVQNQ